MMWTNPNAQASDRNCLLSHTKLPDSDSDSVLYSKQAVFPPNVQKNEMSQEGRRR